MNIYQPMLFVGLGGTGCNIGAALERRLREELCGPDGTDLMGMLPGRDYLPFQLPACTQFVYADLNDAELARMEEAVVPSAEHRAAGRRTTHLVTELVPHHDTYPEVARSLRVRMPALVGGWLPAPRHEPRVAPLRRGAGQLPTVARAALFETFRNGLAAARDPLRRAISELAKARGELAALGSNKARLDAMDIYVAFSVAGGTGAGIFYDFLHLIGDVVQQEFPPDFKAQIYPLVIMPSAFPEGRGGGRKAVLNAGRGLLDLFRLVDDQNGQAALTDLDGMDDEVLGSLSVRYSDDRDIRLRASTIQTAFLFSSSPGIEREDLHRSVVSLILSLVGTEMTEEDLAAPAGDRMYASFADSFINGSVEREPMAPTGIGRRGVSTGLVASLTVPAEDLADIVASRMLAAAVHELSASPAAGSESNRALIERFLAAANLQPLTNREGIPFSDPAADSPKGADAIQRALGERLRLMQGNVEAMSRQLPQRVRELAGRFDPQRAVEELLSDIDLFRLHRVVAGDPAAADETDRLGVDGLLRRRRETPPAPQGLGMTAPGATPLRGLRRWRWNDAEVQRQVWAQDAWYLWRTRCLWNEAWTAQTPSWQPKIEQLLRRLGECVGAFRNHADQDPVRFRRRVEELYRPRAGVCYLLPPQGKDLRLFYQNTVGRFAERFAGDGMSPNASEGVVVARLLRDDWWKVFAGGRDRGPAVALEAALDQIKPEVTKIFRRRSGDQRPLLPEMADLLAQAAGKTHGKVSAEDLGQFRQDLAALLPGGFSPQGTGALRVLITYPAGAVDADLERYIEGRLNLPRTRGLTPEYRPVGSESITVVLFRTAMGVTEVPELRDVLHQWALALKHERAEDYLQWRQRLGFDYGYLATTPEHREAILHRFLSALWNGQVAVRPGDDPSSPSRVTVRLRASDTTTMTLPLTPFERASSWGSVIRAYEEWVIKDDQLTRREFCEELMEITPEGLETRPSPPHELYNLVVGMAPKQQELLEEMVEDLPPSARAWAEMLLEFWRTTLPRALRHDFVRVARPVRHNLYELEREVRGRGVI
ncbi:tubulin-like doman-containing protein [Sinosporangium siamense]|uniref:Tubulin like n=1 Tax=Sinosporangium siamense TaxID=1367973 RepID=A0A919RAI0_9ACTN|nr:tubulin-like doman-containing protein [Sinosporangium siamense]GII90052.1 hypothetical protein Ssi02_02830 [Sinosporangium siamense]